MSALLLNVLRGTMRYILLVLMFTQITTVFGEERIPKTEKVNQSIIFEDDLDFENMKLAISRQLKSFSDLKTEMTFGSDKYKREDLKTTLEYFLTLVKRTQECMELIDRVTCMDQLSLSLNTEFNIYKPIPETSESGYKTGKTLFTAYYSPDMHGSKTQTDKYKYPIYTEPKDVSLKSLTREEIDFEDKLKGKGLELFYVSESLYDIWLLHVEGGGRVQVENEDGTIEKHFLSYQSTNKKTFNMLYKYMIANNMLQAGNAGIDQQRQYLEDHPEDQRVVLSSCPSYVFFKVTDDEPLGVKNIPLTENRSLASDYRKYKEYGILNFIQAKMPTHVDGQIQMLPFSRFFINQDTGGAIKGNARSDLYFGFGKKAEVAASNLKELGNQYFLIKK